MPQTDIVPQKVTQGEREVKPFFEVQPDGRMKFYLDNTRLSTFTQCPTLFDYTQMRNLRSKGVGKALSIGQWWSQVLEMLYREMSFGHLPTPEQMVTFASDAWNELRLGNSLSQFKTNKFTPEKAILMCQQYYNNYAEADFKQWQIIATECGFGLKDEVLVGEDDDVIVYLVGKPDLFVLERSSGKLLVVDHKTVEYIQNKTIIKFKPHSQTAGYVLTAQRIAASLGIDSKAITDRCIINVCARGAPSDNPRDGVKKPRFVRAYPNYTQDEIKEWQRSTLDKAREIKRSIVCGYYRRHENTCHLYGGCSFRGVCSVPPGVRDVVLKADFVQVEPWSPYDIEDEEEA